MQRAHSDGRSAGTGPTRRAVLQAAAWTAVGWACPARGTGDMGLLAAEAEKPAPPPAKPEEKFTPLNRFPDLLQRYFTAAVRDAEHKAQQARDALRTKAEAEAYVQAVRAKIQTSFGPFPEKTPLNPRVTGVVEREAYNVEKVIFESRPEFFVTANLYVPQGRSFPLPGVVGTCGHSNNGKAAEAYQSFAQALARLGYVVLIFDPIGQGERLQYAGADLKSRVGVGVAEHIYAGNQQYLVGEFFGTWRAWDGIRALDYLLSRPEVDPRHVGVTGNSGGGTMTTWLCGVEPRWTMAAPSCFVTTFRRNLENELPQDTEQCPPQALALGLDHSDFLAAMAPKPVRILCQEQDYFDARGAEETYARLKRLYGLLGAEDNISLFVGPTYHGYSVENRLAMYQWFNRATGLPPVEKEPDLTLEKDETLYCTPRGQVLELKSRTVHSFTLAKARDLAARRAPLAGPALAEALTAQLRLPPRAGIADYRILRTLPSRKYPQPHCAMYAVETEPLIPAIVTRLADKPLMSRPPRGIPRAVLYVPHLSSDAELREEPLVKELLQAEPDAAFYACDVRGTGESQPNTCGLNQFFAPYGNEFFYASHAIMLDYPLLGQKTFDLLRVLDWLASLGHNEIHLAAKGRGTFPATFAAVLSERVVQVTLKNALASYQAVAESEEYRWPLSTLLPRVLEKFDLPDCYRQLEAKQLRQIEPAGVQET